MRADPASQGLGITKVPGASWSARKRFALSLWLTVIAFLRLGGTPRTDSGDTAPTTTACQPTRRRGAGRGCADDRVVLIFPAGRWPSRRRRRARTDDPTGGIMGANRFLEPDSASARLFED